MVTLRVDPWDPERGASYDATEEGDTPPDIDTDVEPVPWQPIHPPTPAVRPCCAFIDGVRRIDLRLYAEENGSIAPALVGSWATGVVWADSRAHIEEVRVGRRLVIGNKVEHANLEARVGDHTLVYVSSTVKGTKLQDPVQGLQTHMRAAEAKLAKEIGASGDADLVIADGPLTYLLADADPNVPVIGLAKRQTRPYLSVPAMLILRELPPGGRTPLFQIKEQRPRYSWYARLADRRSFDGTLTGIVRMELFIEIGLDNARALADLTSATLPQFASAIGRDPRAPQNLYPVGQLEKVLQHRMGHRILIRRALEAAVWRANVRTI